MKNRRGKAGKARRTDRVSLPLLEHILVGVGGSEPSLAALRYALHLARESASRGEALIVEELRLPGSAHLGDGDVLGHLVEEARERMVARWDAAERQAKTVGRQEGHPVQTRRERGRVVERIVAAAEKASLLVLGKTGCRGERDGMLGSNTELVLQRTHKPVLLTPDGFEPPGSVLVAYRGTGPDRVGLKIGLDLSQVLGLPLFVLTVEEEAERCEGIWSGARQAMPDLDAAAFFEQGCGEVAETIIERAGPRTLLVMGAYGHTRLYRFVLGSVTQEVMRAAEGPVLLCGK
jgi:nucleotide-binding universal stress UspA family protein